MASFLMVLPLALVMGLGVLFRRLGLLDERTVHRLNSILYWAALPALLFRSILKVDQDILSNPNLFWAAHATFLIGPALALFLGRAFTSDRRVLAVSALISIRSNNVFLGIPAVMTVMGIEGLQAISLYLAVSLLGYNLLSIIWAQLVLSGKLTLRSLITTLGALLKNPLILACLMGVAGSLAGFNKLPQWFDSALKMVGDSGSGIALIVLGATIRFENLGEAMKSTWRDCLFKLFICPAIILCAFQIWPVNQVLRNTVVLTSAMPAATHNFVIAQSMEMDHEYAGKIVTLSTALSMFTLPIWVWILGI